MPRKTFFLKQWREHLGLSQEALGNRLDTTGATISRIENGKNNFKREMLEEIADALGVEPGDLYRDPTKPDYQLWKILTGMPPEQQRQALKIIQALEKDVA